MFHCKELFDRDTKWRGYYLYLKTPRRRRIFRLSSPVFRIRCFRLNTPVFRVCCFKWNTPVFRVCCFRLNTPVFRVCCFRLNTPVFRVCCFRLNTSVFRVRCLRLNCPRVSGLGYVVEDGQVDLELPRDLIDRVVVRVVVNGLVVQQKLHSFKGKNQTIQTKKC